MFLARGIDKALASFCHRVLTEYSCSSSIAKQSTHVSINEYLPNRRPWQGIYPVSQPDHTTFPLWTAASSGRNGTVYGRQCWWSFRNRQRLIFCFRRPKTGNLDFLDDLLKSGDLHSTLTKNVDCPASFLYLGKRGVFVFRDARASVSRRATFEARFEAVSSTTSNVKVL